MPLKNKQILIIDDDESILRILQKIVEGAGAACIVADSTAEGIKMALSSLPHLIITDLYMPNEDGFSFLSKRKMTPQLQKIPTIILSATTERADFSHAMALGATDYLNKPIQAAAVIQKIRKCFLNADHALSYKIAAPIKITLKTNAELIGVSDDSMILECQAKLEQGKTIQIESTLLDECGIKNQLLKILRSSEGSNIAGQYMSKVKFVSLCETDKITLKNKTKEWD